MPTLLEQITKTKSPLSSSKIEPKKSSPLTFLSGSATNIQFPTNIGLTLPSPTPVSSTPKPVISTPKPVISIPASVPKPVNQQPTVQQVQVAPNQIQTPQVEEKRPPTPPVSFVRESGSPTTTSTNLSDEEILKGILTKQKKEQFPSLSSQEVDFLVNQQIDKSKVDVAAREQALREQTARAEQLRLQEEERLTNLLKEETSKRAKNTAQQLEQYRKELDEIYQPQIARAEQAGKERTAIRERLAGVAGNLTTATGVQALEEISRDTENTVNAINAAKRLEFARKQAELEGVDSETLSAISNQLSLVKQRQQELTTNLENNLAQLKFDALEAGDLQRQQLIQSALDTVSTKKVENYDADLTKIINDGFLYTSDEKGIPTRVRDAEGNEINIIGDEIVNIGGRAFDTKRKTFIEFGGSTSDVSPISEEQITLSREDKDKINANIRKTDEYKSLTKLNPVLQALNDFKTAWETNGKKFSFAGPTAGELAGAYNNMITQLKEFYNLGALTGPDERILKSTVPDPTSPISYRFGADTIDIGLNNITSSLSKTIEERANALYDQFGFYRDVEALDTVEKTTGVKNPKKTNNVQSEQLDDQFSDSKFQEFLLGEDIDLNDQSAVDEAYQIFSNTSNFNESLSKDAKGSNLNKIVQSIGQYESGNNYKALGPVIPSGTYKGDRALGKYQIMSKNLPQWSKEAVGRVVSKEEFLNNPQLQDKIANFKLGQIYNRYGTLEDTASVWFTGQPVNKSKGKKDLATGVSSENYINNIRNIYNNLI